VVCKSDASIGSVKASRTGREACSVADGILVSRVTEEEAREREGLEGFRRGRREMLQGPGSPMILVLGGTWKDRSSINEILLAVEVRCASVPEHLS
jgi:hypothetical protein